MVELSETRNANSGRNLPVCIGPSQERRRFGRTRQHADFVSQLIAARDRLPVQRDKRRAGEGAAKTAYSQTAHLDERRMPPGYRLSVSA